MIAAVELPSHLRDRLRDEALRAYPRECCGLVEGHLTLSLSKGTLSLSNGTLRQSKGTLRQIPAKAGKGEPGAGNAARITALHPMANTAKEADRFEIDPACHLALLRNLRGTGREVIGCYHSHPNGRPDPSARDRDNACEDGFLWLIVAVNCNAVEQTELAAFVRTGQSFSAAEIVDALPRPAGALNRLDRSVPLAWPTAKRGPDAPLEGSLDRLVSRPV